MKLTIWASFGLVALISVQVTNAFLFPSCSNIPFKPGCTNTPSLVSPTLPACPLPFEQWATAARAAPGNSPRPNGVIPTWFNQQLALRGQQVTSEYRFPWYIVMFFGLLIEINMPDIRNPIMFNKKNTNGPDNARRDIATIMQGLVWTKDYFYRLPVEGHSSFIVSIKNVRATHIDVQTRANAKIASTGCIITPDEYENQATNDALWNAFEWDIGNSSIPLSQRTESPTNWLTCPPETDCGSCGGCANCVPVYNFENCTGVNNVNCTVLNTTCTDYLDEPCISGSVNCTCVYEYNLPEPECIQANENCTIVQTNCTDCSACGAATCTQNAVPACQYMQPSTYHCDTCICDPEEENCGQCETCTNSTSCLSFIPPLYNQQGMNLVLYNLIAYPILFSQDLAINACDADLWAFNHLWASIGYALGIDDQYNVMLQPDLASAKVYYNKIFDNIIIPGLFSFTKQTRLMMDNVFKGLSTATAGFLSPTFLLHRFVNNFLNKDAPRLQALMSVQELALDQAFDFAYIPQFMNNAIYRAFLNAAINDYSYSASALLFPGNCTSYTTISQKCFVY